MKSFLQKQLIKKAVRLVQKFKPHIIAITGSVGKTSTKKAIAVVLEHSFRVRVAKHNYNNEIGVPLAVLGKESPGMSLWGWIKILLQRHKTFPEMLVLEFAADKPGDLSFLCKFFTPEVGVLTAISPVHVENYPSLQDLIKEKSEILRALPATGLAVINADDEQVWQQKEHSKAPVIGYGFSQKAQVRAKNYDLQTRLDDFFEPTELFSQVVFFAEKANEEIEVLLKNTIGKQQVSAALAALAVGSHFGLSFTQMAKDLQENYQPPNGRLCPLAGIKGTLLLDDTYNAAPASMKAALEVLKEFEPSQERRRIAVLGDMAELGSLSENEHRQVGLRAAEGGVDLLVCVGEKAQDIARAAQEAGMEPDHVQYFLGVSEAGRWLDREIKKGDILLIKGSQSMRMEKIVKELMAEPLLAQELLVRQYGKWLDS